MPDPLADLQHDSELLDSLRLQLIAGIGPRLQQALLERFGHPREVLEASLDELRQVPGIGPKLATAVLAGRRPEAAEAELERCRTLGVRLLRKNTEGYPTRLAEICDAPSILYCRGELLPRDGLSVAIVGSRRCTLYGQQQAERLAGALARAGVTVVSGLARGIDSAAHRGALAADGRTVAVLGTGLANIYPPENVELADRICTQGALLSESPLDQQPVPGIFPQRNRIISGMSLGVIVIEASRTSGSLHTARHALEQNREVFAVPGRIDSLASEGCHDLIRDGAALVRNVDDVLEALGPLTAPVRTAAQEVVHNPRELTLNDQEREVLNQVGCEPVHIDQMVQATRLETARVLQTLTVLEMKRLIRRLPGGLVCRY
jgi:DNA processing protein